MSSSSAHYCYSVDYAEPLIDKTYAYSSIYKDIYFNSDTPIEETKYVFTDPGMHNLLSKKAQTLVLAELGFGFGLNFISSFQSWTQKRSSEQNLCYISFEKHPVSSKSLKSFYGNDLKLPGKLAEEVLRKLAAINPGINYFNWPEHRTCLLLVIGDANQYLPLLKFKADYWYLDGFSPSNNPELWNDQLIEELTKHSNTTCGLSTFSAAGHLKRKLIANNWSVSKHKGYANKREMLKAELNLESAPKTSQPKHIAIIGAGIAGCSLAYSLAQYGIEVDLFDKHSEPAGEASGNPLALVMPNISQQADARSFLFFQGLQLFNQQLEELDPDLCISRGILRFPTNDRLHKLIDKIPNFKLPQHLATIVNPAAASELLGVNTSSSAIYFPAACSVTPHALCQKYIENNNIQYRATEVERITNEAGQWQVWDKNQTELGSYQTLVLSNANQVQQLVPDSKLPMQVNRGQVLTVTLEKTELPKLPFCFQGYLAPINQNQYLLGSTYERSKELLSIDQVLSQLTDKLNSALPHSNLTVQAQKTRIATRCTTADRLPIVGELRSKYFEEAPGLYVSTAFGSRGFTLAPIVSDYLAATIMGNSLPIESQQIKAIAVDRFKY